MNRASELQSTINQLRRGELAPADIRQCLNHASPVIRANAIEACGLLASQDASFISDLKGAALDRSNDINLMGAITLAHVAIGCLLKIENTEAKNAAAIAIRSLPNAQQEDLLLYLKSENIPL
ncbi:hypothetical protein BH10PLA2_BH10PLA2_10780 [soil metagenome]